MKKGKRGNKYEQVAEMEVDLHGYTTHEAKVVLEELLRECEYSHIRIIVGKGTRSENGPVLPDFVRNFLTEHNIRFNTAKIQHGGEGALDVFL